ncbi:molybdenum cofactor biosynthesis protein MoaE [Breoghania sp. L-A4]|uniref:molybdenum cofactor biosynthesis protein MoaE n=1 Tax=Breoghania sp. L-A4 TaxID=2304600 RepID=UPI000E357FF5|nr:molybdenum cofactor biosynthesis protein MoaE [Breoghania sp. L-A4]AXS41438.1 molybdenum cofactor biosynthesis protein MoaE [Breoghania sp. L-A4]
MTSEPHASARRADAPQAPVRISIQAEDFDSAAEIARLAEGRTDVGAVVSFTGLCRDEGGTLEALELEHYPGMAEGEISRIVDDAVARWPLAGVTVIHRHGKIAPGGNIVLVVTASAHRGAAFAAGEFLMDFLKTRAPFWKKEHRRDGTATEWVEAAARDDEATERW